MRKRRVIMAHKSQRGVWVIKRQRQREGDAALQLGK